MRQYLQSACRIFALCIFSQSFDNKSTLDKNWMNKEIFGNWENTFPNWKRLFSQTERLLTISKQMVSKFIKILKKANLEYYQHCPKVLWLIFDQNTSDVTIIKPIERKLMLYCVMPHILVNNSPDQPTIHPKYSNLALAPNKCYKIVMMWCAYNLLWSNKMGVLINIFHQLMLGKSDGKLRNLYHNFLSYMT